MVALAVLLVSSLLLSSSIGLTALVDAKKSKHSSSSNSASNSNNNNGVITKFTIAVDSGKTGKSLTVEQAILTCPSADNNPNVPASLKPWCDKFITYITDYCLTHMKDVGAKENFQVCYDRDLRDEIIQYLYTNHLVVDGKSPVNISIELFSNAINNL